MKDQKKKRLTIEKEKKDLFGGGYSLVEAVCRGEMRAIARAISLVENDEPGAEEFMREIYRHRQEAIVVGITGAPGTGKSTLVDQLVEKFRKEKIPIGVIAVDPSSPFTGGAILGDRIRMMRHSCDDGVFIRSMATRGYLGGLAKSTGEVIAILEAAGKKYIFVETVGVGQDEGDIVRHSDLVAVILTPQAGDEIQVFKAGVMEIGDLFVLNKADLPETERAERQLRSMLELAGSGDSLPPIIKTVATKGEGIEALKTTIKSLTERQNKEVRLGRRRQLTSWLLRELLREKLITLLFESIEPDEFEALVDEILAREIDPYTAAELLCQKITRKK
ncbi:MAG: methylmalonyl Co-A mutase-associated GTPase MeaB [Candidatus Aminicenantes bacterium]|nr:methylmalonyl Co-A mutase-associated GTPase MeaB [Candidatus Aminicenantes bacterium]